MENHSLKVSRVVETPIDKVWKAWTDPAELKQWYSPEGMEIPEMEADVTEGGSFRVVMQAPDGAQHIAKGMYKTVEEPNKLVFTWQWEDGDMGGTGETQVTVEFKDMGEGKTEVTLIHDMLPSQEAKTEHEKGWTSLLAHSETYLQA